MTDKMLPQHLNIVNGYVAVREHLNDKNTMELYASLEKQVEKFIKEYTPNSANDYTRINFLATRIRELDFMIPLLAKRIKKSEKEMSTILASATLGHGTKYVTKVTKM